MDLVGIDFEEGYYSIFCFPLGIELLIYHGIEIHFTFYSLQFSFGIGKNITLFR